MEERYTAVLENGTVSRESPVTTLSDVYTPFSKHGWDDGKSSKINHGVDQSHFGEGKYDVHPPDANDDGNRTIPDVSSSLSLPVKPKTQESRPDLSQSPIGLLQTCAEIGIQILQLNDDLLASLEEEEKLLACLRSRSPTKKKKVTKCKIFEIGDLVQLFRQFMTNWNHLWPTGDVQPTWSGHQQHLDWVTAPVLQCFVGSLKETLKVNAATFVCRLERLFGVGLDILSLQGLQEVPASAIQKCISGILEYDAMVLDLANFYPTFQRRNRPTSRRIETMLRLIARERSKIFGHALLDLLDSGVAHFSPNFDRKCETEWPLPLPAPGHADSWCRTGADLPGTSVAGTVAPSTAINPDVGGVAAVGGSTSDYCSGGSLNGNHQTRLDSDVDEVGSSSAFLDRCMALQTLYTQEELNASKLAFVIRLSFLETNGGDDLGVRRQGRALAEPLHARLYWEELEGRTLKHLLDGLQLGGGRHHRRAMVGVCRMSFLMPHHLVELVNVTDKLAAFLEKQIPLVRLYYNVKSYFHLLAAKKSWDQSFCKLLSATSTPKCTPALLSDGSCGTVTGKCITDCLQANIGLELLASTRPDFAVETIHTAIFPLLSVTLQVTHRWLEANIRQSLAQWHICKFGYISQGDLKKVVDLLRHLESINPAQLSSSVLWSGAPCTSLALGDRESLCRRLVIWDEVRAAASRLQNCSSTCMKDFCKAGVAKSRAALNTLMPVGKVWQQSCRRKGVPTACNPYAPALVVEVMVPVVEGVARLPVPAQIGIVTMATKVFVETWMAHILYKRIRFSLHGGHLLRLDFRHLIDFLRRQPALSPETRQSVQSLEVLRQLRGAAALLLHQTEPPSHFGLVRVSRRVSPLGDDQTVITVDSEDSRTADDPDVDTESIGSESAIADEEYVTDRASWLALRVRNGQRRTFAPFWCFA